MFRILNARSLAKDVKWFRIHAPLVALHRQPGQFVIVRLDETGDGIPLTIANSDAKTGTIELIVKAIGKTTLALCAKTAGETIADVAGPLGRPTQIVQAGHAVLIGGGVGVAVIFPLARPLVDAGNQVTAIVGGRSRDLVMLEDELASIAHTFLPCTDDGSYGFHGTVAQKLAELLCNASTPVGVVYAAGPVPMMQAVADITRPTGIRTIVSLNPIMVDGTGMCGGCRVSIDGKMRFACVDGPEFDAHQVDFVELADRLGTYRRQEQQSLDISRHTCQLAAKHAEAIAEVPPP